MAHLRKWGCVVEDEKKVVHLSDREVDDICAEIAEYGPETDSISVATAILVILGARLGVRFTGRFDEDDC